MFVAGALESVSFCYIERVLHDGHVDLLGKPTEMYKAYEVIE